MGKPSEQSSGELGYGGILLHWQELPDAMCRRVCEEAGDMPVLWAGWW